ncbi:10426_t:CDS:2 [Ambispora gerdemannii]|uniref:10426_t:CDS:1 n=1 Tax=Ambispora gerdemannii TaxID=144530 RepID=A0A9N8ZN52_9GLOM|nr:10426_t:CDS:2 [Ambispora gerdemannii]
MKNTDRHSIHAPEIIAIIPRVPPQMEATKQIGIDDAVAGSRNGELTHRW